MTLYTTGCPMCRMVAQQLDECGIGYAKETDEQKMLAMGLKTVPVLKTDDGRLLNAKEAIAYIKELRGNNSDS